MKDNIQLSHADHKSSEEKFPLCIVADNINSPNNIGSLFRLCDAMGVEKMYLCGDTATPPSPKINKTSRSTEKYVNYARCPNAKNLVKKLIHENYYIVSLEITKTSTAINSIDFNNAITDKKPICLILGSENAGIDEKLLALSDITIHIPMHGNNSSMNVISAASIACYEITRHL
jgi:tRNA G18 (ribose-2'-O)-methylase SpoU